MRIEAKNVKTLWREAEKLISEDGALQMVDPLHVIETVMRYFYSLAQTGRKANARWTRCGNAFARRHSWRLRTATRGSAR